MRYLFSAAVFVLLLFPRAAEAAAPTNGEAVPGASAALPTAAPRRPKLADLARLPVVKVPVRGTLPGYTPPRLDLSGLLFRAADGAAQTLANARVAVMLTDVVVQEGDTPDSLLETRGVYADAETRGLLHRLNPSLQFPVQPGQHAVAIAATGGPILQKALAENYRLVLIQNYQLKRHLFFSQAKLKRLAERLPPAGAEQPAAAEWGSLRGSVDAALGALDETSRATSERKKYVQPELLQHVVADTDRLAKVVARACAGEGAPATCEPDAKDVEIAGEIARTMQAETKPLLWIPPVDVPQFGPPSERAHVTVTVYDQAGKPVAGLVIHCVPEALWEWRKDFAREFLRRSPEDSMELPEADFIFWAEPPDEATPATDRKKVEVRCGSPIDIELTTF